MTEFDVLELSVNRHNIGAQGDTELIAEQEMRDSTWPIRQFVATVLADLSVRIDPKAAHSFARINNN
jgi:hypothetical protein